MYQEDEDKNQKPVVHDSTGFHVKFMPILLLSKVPKKPILPWGMITAFLLVFISIMVLFSEKAVHDKEDTQSGAVEVVFDPPKPPPPPPQPVPPPPEPPKLLEPPPTPQPSDLPPTPPQPKVPPTTRWLPSANRVPKKIVPLPPKPAPTPPKRPARQAPVPSKMVKNDAPAEHSGDMPKGTQLTCSAPEMQYPSSARHAHEEGVAVAVIQINKDGSVRNARLAQSTGYTDLDKQALATISNLHCSPPPDGAPMEGRIPMEFKFSH